MSTAVTSSVDNYSWANEFFSLERLGPYLAEFGGNYRLALKAYATDLKALCESALWINLLEISLRNALTKHIEASLAFGKAEWFLAIEPLLATKGRDALSIAKKRIIKNGDRITGATMTAAMPFGFWVNLMARHHEATIWTPALRRAFPNLRRPNRHFVNMRLSEIYRLRNHVAHQGLITVAEMTTVRNQIVEILSWISPEGQTWAKANAPRII